MLMRMLRAVDHVWTHTRLTAAYRAVACDDACKAIPPPEPCAQLQLPAGALMKRLRTPLQRVRQVRRLVPHTQPDTVGCSAMTAST